jgi:hypothetical protein
MEINHLCPLCRRTLSITRESHYALGQTVGEDGIRTTTLTLLYPLTDARLAAMVNADARSPTEAFIHPGCWLIAERTLSRRTSIDGKYVSVFLERLIQLSPFLARVPFSCPTGRLDVDIFVPLKNWKRTEPPSPFARCPTEVVQNIFAFLELDRDVSNLCEFLRARGPSPRHCREIGHTYGLKEDADAEISVPILLRNIFQQPPTRFPFTTNYRVVSDNVRLISSTMEKPNATSRVTHNVPYSATLVTERPSCRYAMRTNDVRYITLWFSRFGRRQFLCGIALNGTLFGYTGEVRHAVRVASLRGLYVAVAREDIVAVQVKDITGWLSDWYGLLPAKGSFIVLECDSSQSDFVVSYDVSLTFSWMT